MDGLSERARCHMYTRLRRPPSPSSLRGSVPVLFFGDIQSARVATVALNPGPDQRFLQNLSSLSAPNRHELTTQQCDRAIASMREYFGLGHVLLTYFRGLDRVTKELGASYAQGGVVHLDIVQEATDPQWSDRTFPETDKQELLRVGRRFFRWQLQSFLIQLILCNGKTVSREVKNLLWDVKEWDHGKLNRVEWYCGTTKLREREGWRELGLAGWNLPLDKPTGLGHRGEEALGKLIGDCFHRYGFTADWKIDGGSC